MKNKKDFIVNKEDMNNNEESKKEQKRSRIEKFCIFASAAVLLGSLTGIALNNNKYNDDVRIESTSSEKTSGTIIGYNYKSEMVIIDVKDGVPIYKKVTVKIPIYDDEILDSSIENEHSSKIK